MFKLLLILLLAYLIFRAGRNLLRAAVQDGLMSDGRAEPGNSRAPGRDIVEERGRHRGRHDEKQIQDAVWEDLP